MTVDHVGAVLFPQYTVLRVIGRLAFPIFAYLLVEGFCYTKDIRKYMCRMGVFALISEIPFDLATTGKVLEFGHQNVYFTLFLGLLMLWLLLKTTNRVSKVGYVLLLMLIADVLHTDYGSMGLLMILCFYLYRDRMGAKIASMCIINIVLMGYVQGYGALAAIPIALHNRKQGAKLKYLFYAFYPVHLFVLWMIRMTM